MVLSCYVFIYLYVLSDLLKMIKSDLRKLKQETQDEKYIDSSNDHSSAVPDLTQHTSHKYSARPPEVSVSAPRKRHTKGTCYR